MPGQGGSQLLLERQSPVCDAYGLILGYRTIATAEPMPCTSWNIRQMRIRPVGYAVVQKLVISIGATNTTVDNNNNNGLLLLRIYKYVYFSFWFFPVLRIVNNTNARRTVGLLVTFSGERKPSATDIRFLSDYVLRYDGRDEANDCATVPTSRVRNATTATPVRNVDRLSSVLFVQRPVNKNNEQVPVGSSRTLSRRGVARLPSFGVNGKGPTDHSNRNITTASRLVTTQTFYPTTLLAPLIRWVMCCFFFQCARRYLPKMWNDINDINDNIFNVPPHFQFGW